MPGIPLEDNFTDILGKAQRGLGLARRGGFSDSDLVRRAGISTSQLSAAKAARADDTVIRKLATALNLGPDALVASAKQSWRPADPGPIDGLACFNTPFSDMTVNAYLVWDPQTRRAAAFDTGTDCDPMLELARDHKLKIELILLTHTHSDHVYELDRLKEATGAAAYVSEREPLAGATAFPDGHVFEVVERASRPTEWDRLPACPPTVERASRPFTGQSSMGVPRERDVVPNRVTTLRNATRGGDSRPPAGPKTGETPVPPSEVERASSPLTGQNERAGRPFHLMIETRRTSGHARGGTTFVVTLPVAPTAVTGLPQLAIVGDALFAGSMGGGLVDYDEALRTNRESIFTLPDDTIICPGHGPLTTVGEEKQHNPFFPEFQR